MKSKHNTNSFTKLIEQIFCNLLVTLPSRCVAAEYRINSVVSIPNRYFQDAGFVLKFELYVKSLIELTSNDKTLEQLMAEFDGMEP